MIPQAYPLWIVRVTGTEPGAVRYGRVIGWLKDENGELWWPVVLVLELDDTTVAHGGFAQTWDGYSESTLYDSVEEALAHVAASRSRWVTESRPRADAAQNVNDLGPAPWVGRVESAAAALPEDIAWLLGRLLDAVEPVEISVLAAQADAQGLRWDTVSRKARRRGLTSTRQLPGRAGHWVCELSEAGWILAGRVRELA